MVSEVPSRSLQPRSGVKQLVPVLVSAIVLLMCVACRNTSSQPINTPLAANVTHAPQAGITGVALRPSATPFPTWTPTATFTPYPSASPVASSTFSTSAPLLALTSTATMIPTATPTPNPSPTAPDAQPCVNIASDSNGIGEVTAQIPSDGSTGVIEVQPLSSILQVALKQRNLGQFSVIDHSMTAASLTDTGRTYYFASPLYQRMLSDGCRYSILGPFLDDLLNTQATPQQYVVQMMQFVRDLAGASPRSTIFVLSHYQTKIAPFVNLEIYGGFNSDRIAAFQDTERAACQLTDVLAGIPQVVCVDTQALFKDMDDSYLFTGATLTEYQALLTKPSKFTPEVNAYFDSDPQGRLIGDGFHLSLLGRQRLMGWIADYIAGQNKS